MRGPGLSLVGGRLPGLGSPRPRGSRSSSCRWCIRMRWRGTRRRMRRGRWGGGRVVDLRSRGTRAGFLSRVALNASGGVLRGWGLVGAGWVCDLGACVEISSLFYLIGCLLCLQMGLVLKARPTLINRNCHGNNVLLLRHRQARDSLLPSMQFSLCSKAISFTYFENENSSPVVG